MIFYKKILQYLLGNKTIWVLEEIGDDYHGGSIIGVYDNKSAAEKQKAIENTKGCPCHPEHPKCDFTYHYCIREYTIQSQPTQS